MFSVTDRPLLFDLVFREIDQDSAVREYMRREGEAPAPEDIYGKDKQLPPLFRTELKQLINLKENEPVHFECKLIPIGDPRMKIEWFKDGEPLSHGTFCFLIVFVL